MSRVEARRGLGAGTSSSSADEEEYDSEGAADAGEGVGSSGMQWEVVAVRMAMGRGCNIVTVEERIEGRRMYEDVGGVDVVAIASNCLRMAWWVVEDGRSVLVVFDVIVGQDYQVADALLKRSRFFGASSEVGQCRGTNDGAGHNY